MRITAFDILVFVVGLSSCGPEPKDAYSKVANSKVELIPPFHSYESISAISKKLADQAHRGKVTEDSKLPPNDRRPRFDIYAIEIPDREFCGQKGILRLFFFNDRLASTSFYPEQSESCLQHLRSSGIIVSDKQTAVGDAVIWFNIDYKGRRYVLWGDRRLHEEQDRWISKYS
jgi:hypothetical protein